MSSHAQAELYRKLPSVDELLRRASLAELARREGHVAVADAARTVLENLRAEITSGKLTEDDVEFAVGDIENAVEQQLDRALSYSLRPVINATGVILHTNLGRAPLPHAALDHAREVSCVYSNLEFDLAAGERGKRDVHVDRLFQTVLGEDVATIVVNNNAAAVMLALNSLAEGGEVIVSRGELVEIGGSFRIPDVMQKSQAILREVGTTNRTRIADYERAINERTRLLLRVHRSNFEIVGFTEQPSLAELVALGRKRNIPVLEDLGSGALFDLRSVEIQGEATVADSIRAGADVVTYSGDKLLGGPQAGMLSGRPELIAKIRSNPMFRALRADKLVYAVLEATLMAYVKQDYDSIPALRMMRIPFDQIESRAKAVAASLRARSTGTTVELIDGNSVIGGGSAPSAVLPTKLIAVEHSLLSADRILASLRKNDPPIIARVEEGKVLLDLRTVLPGQEDTVVRAFEQL
jgi:L-seryl-tRNA(Ser) seleniumtransferase